MKKVPKEIVHYTNQSDFSRCFVHLYKEYLRYGPPDWPDSAFYLTQSKGDIFGFQKFLLDITCFRKPFPN